MSGARGKLALALALSLLLALLALTLGSASIPVAKVARLVLLEPLGLGSSGLADWQREVVLSVRLPRVALGLAVGAALALAGAVFQGLLRNPLADPFILGTSSGAALGATLLIAGGVTRSVAGRAALPFGAFAGSLLALLAVYLLARSGGRVPVETLLLAGVIVNAFLFALVLLVLAVARLEAAEILLWLMGSLALGGGLGSAAVLGALVLVATLLLWLLARPLNTLTLGDARAAELGIEPERLKLGLFVLVSLLVGATVSVSGIIGFVGLIVPHMARMLVGPDHRRLIPACVLLGASTLVLADSLARVALAPTEVPVGVVMALAGAPFFMWLLRRSRRPW